MALKLAFMLLMASMHLCMGQTEDKAVVFPTGLSDGFSLAALVPTPIASTFVQTSDASNCDTSICEGGSVTAYQANYQDGTSHSLCICSVEPVMTIEYTAQEFGRVCYKVRSQVIGITVASQSLATGGAYTSGDIIRMLQFANTEVFTHEAGHSFDLRTYQYSLTDAFAAAVAADTCVPDDYARTNYVEDFAQLVVTWTYMVLSNNIQDSRFDCMRNQVNFISQYLTPADILTLVASNSASSSTPASSAPSTPGATCSQDYECGSYGQNYGYSRCTSGQCQCGPNFSGAGTTADPCRCDGTVSYTTGSPVCLTAGTCQEDWQCYGGAENSQFVTCNAGRCACRVGFQGTGTPTDKCRCQGSQYWLNGTPYCS